MSMHVARLVGIGLIVVASSRCASSTTGPMPSGPPPPTTGGPWGQLWTGPQPPGTNGHAVIGDNWETQTLTAYTGVSFVSPPLEALRVFDLLDRGFDPQGAINWMNGNGYATSAVYYPAIGVIGFSTEYMALINGRWDLVLRVGA
jgi:hypothetical protein